MAALWQKSPYVRAFWCPKCSGHSTARRLDPDTAKERRKQQLPVYRCVITCQACGFEWMAD